MEDLKSASAVPPHAANVKRVTDNPHGIINGAHFVFFPRPFCCAGLGGSAGADCCTPKSLASITNEIPPTMLLPARTIDVNTLNTGAGMAGCNTMSMPLSI